MLAAVVLLYVTHGKKCCKDCTNDVSIGNEGHKTVLYRILREFLRTLKPDTTFAFRIVCGREFAGCRQIVLTNHRQSSYPWAASER